MQGHGRSWLSPGHQDEHSLLGQCTAGSPGVGEMALELDREESRPISVGLPLVKTQPSSNIIRLIAGRSQRTRTICVTKEWLTACYLYPAPMEHLYCLKIKYQVESEAEINGRNQSDKKSNCWAVLSTKEEPRGKQEIKTQPTSGSPRKSMTCGQRGSSSFHFHIRSCKP